MHVVGQNVSMTQPLPANGRIELAFDQYLLPSTVTRQTFVLRDLKNNFQTPNIAYDPVARIVTLTPTAALEADQFYAIDIDANVLRSIDAAVIDPQDKTIEFMVVAGDAGSGQPAPPTIDFCTDILPIFAGKCAASSCHGGGLPGPAAGLRLDSPATIAATAVGRVAEGANTGLRATPQPARAPFGVNMPIIDPGNGTPAGGNPGNSWLMYKLLLAIPSRSSMTAATSCSGAVVAPTDVQTLHLAQQPALLDPIHDSARAVLTYYVAGREMPFPNDPAAPLEDAGGAPLAIDELERVSRWIAQPTSSGGLVPSSCGCTP